MLGRSFPQSVGTTRLAAGEGMTRLKDLPPEWQARLNEERRRTKEAAQAFIRVCADGDADMLYNAAGLLDEEVDAWRPALKGVARLPGVSAEIQQAFIPIWVEHKMLPLTVGDRRVLADALQVLLPGNYAGGAGDAVP